MQITTRPNVIGGIPRPGPKTRNGNEPAVRSWVKKLSAARDKLINHTREFWQSRLGREVSSEDARQIAENITGFFSVLHEWPRNERLVPSNDAGAAQPRGSSANTLDL